MKSNEKRTYISPKIETAFIELEESIATGSATIKPVGSDGEQPVQESWQVDPDETRTIEW